MMNELELRLLYGALIAAVVLLLLGVRYIRNDRIGIVEKRWSMRGSVKSGIIALRAEAGFQPEILRGGLHWLAPLQYRVHTMPLVTIPQGKIGYVFARDGQPLAPTQVLASNTTANDFQDVRTFLTTGGQRGPQRKILREGTYALNIAQFLVMTENKVYYLPLNRDEEAIFRRMADVVRSREGFEPVVLKGTDDAVAVVTVHEGPSLPQGEIIAHVVGEDPNSPDTYHNGFQDPEKFLVAGGQRGRQLQVLVEGTYYINRLFATVELIPKTVVDVGSVGVVVSYTGKQGTDLTGDQYKHGELVENGFRGVWDQPLLPGKYAFNTFAGKVIMVPTTNFILKWLQGEVGAHRYDENLSEVSLITKDAFEPSLPLSVVVHIDYKKAPLVIQRFGDVKRLVEQTLDPMVAAYFKNVGQTRTLIELIRDRSNIQQQAGREMKERFTQYNLELQEVLIGTPRSSDGDSRIEEILTQLRARQIAEEQVETYGQQEKAAVKERELREAESRARIQQQLTESELWISIQTNKGKAEYQRSLQEASQIRALAEAEAEKLARVGIGQAIAAEELVRAYGGPKYQVTQAVMTRFAEAIQAAKVDVVPKIVIGAGGGGTAGGGFGGSGGSMLEALLALLLSDRMGESVTAHADSPRSPQVTALRAEIQRALKGKEGAEGSSGSPSPKPPPLPTTPAR